MKSNIIKILFLAILLSIMGGCTRPMGYTNEPMQTYDHNTEYTIQDKDNGFTLTVYYERYQFIPESDSVLQACKSNLTAIAYEIAEARGKKIKPINEQRIKVSMGRNGLTGITSCSASVPLEYDSK